MTREDIYTQQFERTKGNWIFILFFVVKIELDFKGSKYIDLKGLR